MYYRLYNKQFKNKKKLNNNQLIRNDSNVTVFKEQDKRMPYTLDQYNLQTNCKLSIRIFKGII